jgi:hypothetical protein
MSSLNITHLYEQMNEKNLKRYEKFDGILQKIHNRIRYNSKLERMHCFYQIPEFIIGTPLYNVSDLQDYLMTSLTKDGFQLLYVEPNWLFIAWETSTKKITSSKDINKVKKAKKVGDFKLIDEYKPSGTFIYNEKDLLSIEEKMNKLR